MTPKRIALVVVAVCMLTMAAIVEAVELSGSWKGTLTGSNGTSGEVQVDFGPQGFPLYSYTNNKGVVRQVELSHVGQTVEYVPAGGGVQRVVVKTLERGPNRIVVGIGGSFERASQGYLDQQQEHTLIEYVLTTGGLAMKVTTRSTSHFGDKDMSVGGDPNSADAYGVLQKLP
jgi:hypothetical protein